MRHTRDRSSAEPIYSFLDNALGSRFSEHSVGALLDVLQKDHVRLAIAAQKLLPRLALSPKEPHEYKPYIPLYTDMLLRHRPADSALVRFMATFAHSVVLQNDAMDQISKIQRGRIEYRVTPQGTFSVEASIAKQVERIESDLTSLARLRDLSEAGAVHWDHYSVFETTPKDLEHGSVYSESRPWVLRYDDEPARFPFPPDWGGYPHAGQLIRQLGDESAAFEYFLNQIQWDISSTMQAAAHGRGDLFLGYPATVRLFELQTRASLRLSQDPLDQLVTLAMPDASMLSLSDVAAVRRSSEHLAQWRNDLREALAAAGVAAQDDNPARRRENFVQHLTPNANKLRSELSGKSARGISIEAVRALSFSAMSSAAVALVGGGELEMVGAAAGGGVSALYAWMSSISNRRVGKAMLSHYSSVGVRSGGDARAG